MSKAKMYCRMVRVANSRHFHQTHGIAHVAYFIAVFAEGHGVYALIGGAMILFSLMNVLTEEH